MTAKVPLTARDEQRLTDVAEWVRVTCEMFGALPSTGYKCAAAFYDGLRWEWEHPYQGEEAVKVDG